MLFSSYDKFIKIWGGLKVAHALEMASYLCFGHVGTAVLFAVCWVCECYKALSETFPEGFEFQS